uniref:YaiO beta-barrel domain-containing protein n=1 Tax=mine drainage metagenome TaxID=410659 RepID=E6Q420_9ZZZZ
MKRWFAFAVASMAAGIPVHVSALCRLPTPPAQRVVVEEGASSAALTKGRGSWSSGSLLVLARDGNERSAYVRAADDVRFGQNDNEYEGGAYLAVTPHVIADIIGSFSPQHNVLPASSAQGDLDFRSGAGYGYQMGYATRQYSTVGASIEHVGMNRYFRDLRLAGNITFARLSNVPGLALSEGVSLGRYLPCDTEDFSVSTGRDVENVAFGAPPAVYHSLTFYLGDTHRLSSHVGLDMGIGWYGLTGAYDRFEVRFALRERL